MTCDVYVLGAPCGTVYVYPSQVHPNNDCTPSAGKSYNRNFVDPYDNHTHDDEAVALALLLLNL